MGSREAPDANLVYSFIRPDVLRKPRQFV